MVESGLHGLDVLKLVLYGVDIFFLKNLAVDSRFVCVLGIYVPCAEHDVVEVGQGHDFVIFQIFLFSAFSYADAVILGHGANRLRKSFAGHQNAGNECRRHSAETDNQYAELTFGFLYITHF